VTDDLSHAYGAVSRGVLATYAAAATHLLECLAAAKSPEALSALRLTDILGFILAKTTPPEIKVTHGNHRLSTYRRWATPLKSEWGKSQPTNGWRLLVDSACMSVCGHRSRLPQPFSWRSRLGYWRRWG